MSNWQHALITVTFGTTQEHATMAQDYAALAPVYDRGGMADFATRISGGLHDYAQAHEWMGRRVLDIGCGTGAVAAWFAENRPRLQSICVDSESTMIEQARSKLQFAEFVVQDLRASMPIHEIDLALAIDVINEFDSVRELETVFKNIHTCLSAGKMFIFDLQTTEGLAQRGRIGDECLAEDSSLAIFAHNAYDYERQAYTCHYTIFHEQDGAWSRGTAQREMKAFPVQAVGALLRRSGFDIMALLDERLAPMTTVIPGTLRVFFVAVKQ
jgi:SAM-dependent methyltransferase